MNDSELEQTITNRLRARIEADHIAPKPPEESRIIAEVALNQKDSSTGRPAESPHIAPTSQSSSEKLPNAAAQFAPPSATKASSASRRHEILGQELIARFLELQSQSKTLAAQLEVGLAAVSQRGVPIPFVVQSAVAAGHREFLKLRRDVLAKLAPLHEGAIDPQRFLGLADLDDLIKRLSGEATTPAPTEPVASADSVAPERPRDAPKPSTPEVRPIPSVPVPSPRVEPPTKAVSLPLPTPWVNQEAVPTSPEPASTHFETPRIMTPAQQPVENSSSDILEKAELAIERILKIKLKPGNTIPEWDEAIASARALKRKVLTESEPDLSAETIALANGRHPMASLWSLIEQTGKLDDMEWAELFGRIEEGLGKPIAMAAARHRFTLDE